MPDASVSLGLDAREFDSRLSTLEQKIQASGQRMGSSFKGILGPLGGFLSAGLGAGAIKSVVDYGTKIQDLSNRFGVSVEAIQHFGNVAEKNGSSLEAVTMGFNKLEIARSKALAGNQEMIDSFLRLGVSFQDLGKLKPEELMLKVGASSMNAADMVKVFGRNSLELRPTLAAIADGFEKMGGAINGINTEKLKQADDFFKSMGQNARIIAANLLGGSLGGFEKVPELAKTAKDTLGDTLSKTFHGNLAGAFRESVGFWKDLFGFGDKGFPSGYKPASELLTARAGGKTVATPKRRDFSEEEDQTFAQIQESSKLSLGNLAGRDVNDISQAIFRGKFIGKDIMLAQEAEREKSLASDAAFAGNENEFTQHRRRFEQITAGIGSLKETEKNIGLKETVQSIDKNVDVIAKNSSKGPVNRG